MKTRRKTFFVKMCYCNSENFLGIFSEVEIGATTFFLNNTALFNISGGVVSLKLLTHGPAGLWRQ